jgi:hypothetical protein
MYRRQRPLMQAGTEIGDTAIHSSQLYIGVENGRSFYFLGVFNGGVLVVRGKWICPEIAFS